VIAVIVLVVTEHEMPFRILEPVAKMLENSGATPIVAASDPSAKLWKASGFQVFPWNGEGAVDEFAERLLRAISPAAVLFGYSDPSKLEAAFAAKSKGRIITFGFPDTYGAEIRIPTPPDVLFVEDEIEAGIAERRGCFGNTEMIIAGSPSLTRVLGSPFPLELHDEVYRLRQRFEHIVLVSGQGVFTGEVLDVALQSALLSHETVGVLVKFHPRFEHTPAAEEWRRQLYVARSVVIQNDDPIHRYPVETLARRLPTVSAFGSPLRVAAYSKKTAVSVATPATRQAMLESMQLSRYPLVEVGAAAEVTEPTPWDTLLPELDEVLRNGQDNLPRLRPDSAALTAYEILDRI
jgi:hypothetical protein